MNAKNTNEINQGIQQILTNGTLEQKTTLLDRMTELAETPDQKATINFMRVYFTNPQATEFVNEYVWTKVS